MKKKRTVGLTGDLIVIMVGEVDNIIVTPLIGSSINIYLVAVMAVMVAMAVMAVIATTRIVSRHLQPPMVSLYKIFDIKQSA